MQELVRETIKACLDQDSSRFRVAIDATVAGGVEILMSHLVDSTAVGNGSASNPRILDITDNREARVYDLTTHDYLAFGNTLIGVGNTSLVLGVSSLALGVSLMAAGNTLLGFGLTSLASLDSKIPAKGQTTMAFSIPVVWASDQTPVRGSTATMTSLARSNGSTLALAANSNRRGLYLTNDSAANCYIAMGATATTTSYTIRLTSNDAYVDNAAVIYTGILSAIWTNNGAGDLLITEIT